MTARKVDINDIDRDGAPPPLGPRDLLRNEVPQCNNQCSGIKCAQYSCCFGSSWQALAICCLISTHVNPEGGHPVIQGMV